MRLVREYLISTPADHGVHESVALLIDHRMSGSSIGDGSGELEVAAISGQCLCLFSQ